MDFISGGLADGSQPADFDQRELQRGISVEMEHTSNPAVAREIAMDHLTEDSEYYKKLALMESGKYDRFLSKSFGKYISKAVYWEHVDGTLWWRNPKSNHIEPYQPSDHSESEQEAKNTHQIASSLVGIHPQSVNAAVYAARSLIAAIKQGVPQDKAITALVNSAKKAANLISDPKQLNNRMKSFDALGFSEAADVFEDKLKELGHSIDSGEVQKPQLGKDTVLIDGKPTKYTVVSRNIGGSTGAYVVNANGENYVVKEYDGNEAQVKNEYLANTLYDAFNLHQSPASIEGKVTPAPDSKLVDKNGKKVLFSPFISDFTTLQDAEIDEYPPHYQEEITQALNDNFVVDAWLANWDVIGLEEDNVGVSMRNGIPVLSRIDNGGSLFFRAQGSPKGDAFGKEVKELDTMRDINVSWPAAEYFGKITDEALVESINAFDSRIKKIGASGIQDIVLNAGYSDTEAVGLTNLLMSRYSSMMDYRDKLLAKRQDKINEAVAESGKLGYFTSGEAAFEHFKTLKITPAQHSSIDAFTSGKDETDPANYAYINRELYEGNMTKEAKTLLKAIEKLPRVGGITMRGIEEPSDSLMASVAQWKSGKWPLVEWSSFSSSTLNPGHMFDATDSVSFIIQNKGIHGRYIAPLSESPYEDEVLYKPGAKFRVVGYSDANGTTVGKDGLVSRFGTTFILEEITNEEAESMKGPQPKPQRYEPSDLVNYVTANAKPSNGYELSSYKKKITKT